MSWDGMYDWGSYRFLEATPERFTAVFSPERALFHPSEEFALSYDSQEGLSYSTRSRRGPMLDSDRLGDLSALITRYEEREHSLRGRLRKRVTVGELSLEPYAERNRRSGEESPRVMLTVRQQGGASFYYFDREQLKSVGHALWWWQEHRQEMSRELPGRQMKIGEGERPSYEERLKAIQEELGGRPDAGSSLTFGDTTYTPSLER